MSEMCVGGSQPCSLQIKPSKNIPLLSSKKDSQALSKALRLTAGTL